MSNLRVLARRCPVMRKAILDRASKDFEDDFEELIKIIKVHAGF